MLHSELVLSLYTNDLHVEANEGTYPYMGTNTNHTSTLAYIQVYTLI